MTRAIALGMLGVANTGNDILQVLDVIQQDTDSSVKLTENDSSITLEFWCLLCDYCVSHSVIVVGYYVGHTVLLCGAHMCPTQ